MVLGLEPAEDREPGFSGLPDRGSLPLGGAGGLGSQGL